MPKRTTGALQLSFWEPEAPASGEPDFTLLSPKQGEPTDEASSSLPSLSLYPQLEEARAAHKAPRIAPVALDNPRGDFDAGKKLSEKLARELNHVVSWSGHRSTTVFTDWLHLVECTLKMQSEHLAALSAGLPLPEDPPEIAALWKGVRDRYGPKKEIWDVFTRAYALLVYECPPWQDVLGLLYMEWGWPNRATGQFFTPWHVARVMAEMTVSHDELDRRIGKAIAADERAWRAMDVGGPRLVGEQWEAWMVGLALPRVIMNVEPVTMNDPACGSGIMLLAAASCLPEWAVKLGLYQFYGQDIDPVCCQMARINARIHGLNGYGSGDVGLWVNRVFNELPADLQEEGVRIDQQDTERLKGLLKLITMTQDTVEEVAS